MNGDSNDALAPIDTIEPVTRRPDDDLMSEVGDEDVTTPKCTKMLADINAYPGDLAAKARALKS